MADKNSSIAPARYEVPLIGAKQDSAEAKPKRRQAAKIKAVPPAPASPDARPRDLAPVELELLAAYAGMTPWARDKLMFSARDYLGMWPINRAPALRLVVGGVA